MQLSSIPTKIAVPWGNAASGGFIRTIPVSSQIGIQAGAASFTDGFPPVCFNPIGGGGTPPFGQDFNGILNILCQWIRWHNAGGQVQFDSSFASTVGGYPSGAVVESASIANTFWLSTVDNNSNNPDAAAGPTGWTGFGMIPTGAMTLFAGSTAPLGWVWCAGQGLSTTTFVNLFNTIGYTYGGAGATFNVPDLRGRAPFGNDAMGGSAAGRITGGGGNFNGSILGNSGGSQNVTLNPNQIPQLTFQGTQKNLTVQTIGQITQTSSITYAADDTGVQAQGGGVPAMVTPLWNPSGGHSVSVTATINTRYDQSGPNDQTNTIVPVGTVNNTGSQGGSHPVINPALIVNFIMKT